MSKKCPYCGNFRNVCVSPVSLTHVCLACEKIFREGEQPKQTVFDRLTASPEVLAPQFVYRVTSFLDGLDKPKKIWYSTLIQGRAFASETEAKRATVAKLKEVAE